MNRIITVTGMATPDFLQEYAQPGRVGLSGGVTLIDKAIARAERHLDDECRWSLWSHAFLFQGRRPRRPPLGDRGCSAFVQFLFCKAGIDLAPGVAKNTTPEDISRATIPHVTYLLKRGAGRSKLDNCGSECAAESAPGSNT